MTDPTTGEPTHTGLLASQIAQATTAAAETRWAAHRARAHGEQLIAEANATHRPDSARRLRHRARRLLRHAEQLEDLAAANEQVARTANAILEPHPQDLNEHPNNRTSHD